MSTDLYVRAFTSKRDPEFLKHHKAVAFCIENELSFPKETEDFFKGKIAGDDLSDFKPESIMQYIEDGVEFELPCGSALYHSDAITLYPKKIPDCVEAIRVEYR